MYVKQLIYDLKFIESEIFILCASFIALIYGMIINDRKCNTKYIILCGMYYGIVKLIQSYILNININIFYDAIAVNNLVIIFKILILISGIIAILIMPKTKFELPIFIAIATISLMLMVSSNDLMTMYITMETASIAMYIYIVSNRNCYNATEAGLKYFIIGSITSCLFLFGVSILSGFTGSFVFKDIEHYIFNSGFANTELFLFSLILVLSAFFFKMSLFPFHAWLPDVYQAATVEITLFLGSAFKIAISGLFVRWFLYFIFDIQSILIIMSISSIFIGAISAIMQTNLRRMLAYSSINNIGFAIAGISTSSIDGVISGYIYIIIYIFLMFIPSFILVNILSSTKYDNSNQLFLSDLRELSISNPYKTALLTLCMISTAGLPPFCGFFGKFLILKNIIHCDMEILALLFMTGALLSTVYCLKVVKNIYFVNINFNTILPTKTLYKRFEVILISMLCIINILYCVFMNHSIAFLFNIFEKLL